MDGLTTAMAVENHSKN